MFGLMCCAVQWAEAEQRAIVARLRPVEVGPHFRCAHLTVPESHKSIIEQAAQNFVQFALEGIGLPKPAAQAADVAAAIAVGLATAGLLWAVAAIAVGEILSAIIGLFFGAKYTRFALGPGRELLLTPDGMFPAYLSHCYPTPPRPPLVQDVPVFIVSQSGPQWVYAPPGTFWVDVEQIEGG